MKSQFVTCLYDRLYGTKFCGRQNRGQHYKWSLSSIAKCQTPISCYTSSREAAPLDNYFKEQCGNITLKPWDLDTFYFHEDVEKVRASNEEFYRHSHFWMFRCVELMWGKFLFIQKEIEESPDLDYIFWIDSGLSHSGIIHSRFNPNYSHNINFRYDKDLSTLRLPFDNSLIFTPKFMQYLIAYTGDNILNIVSSVRQHSFLPTQGLDKGSVIGGIFGGKRNIMLDYCHEVISQFEDLLSSGHLVKEEQIMTRILAEDKFPTKVFRFDTWYHGDWDKSYYNRNLTSFCDFFDEIRGDDR